MGVKAVYSVNDDIAVCVYSLGIDGFECCVAIDLQSGKMRVCETTYQTPDGRLVTSDGLYDMRSGLYTDTILKDLTSSTVSVIAAGPTGENSACVIVQDGMSCWLVRIEDSVSAVRQNIWSGDTGSWAKAPREMYVSPNGTVCVLSAPVNLLSSCILCYPDQRIGYMSFDAKAKGFLLTEEPDSERQADSRFRLFGFLPDGRLLAMIWPMDETEAVPLYAIDTQTMECTELLKDTGLPITMYAFICGDRLYYCADAQTTGYIVIN